MRQNFLFLDKWESDGATHGDGEIREWMWFCFVFNWKNISRCLISGLLGTGL